MQFTVKVRNALGWSLLADLARDIPGRNVIVEIDSVNDNATITVSAEGSGSAAGSALRQHFRFVVDDLQTSVCTSDKKVRSVLIVRAI